MHRFVTLPDRLAVERYRSEIHIFAEREKGHPSAPRTVKQFFKKDLKIIDKVIELVRERGLSPTDSKAKTKISNELFLRHENTVGGLDRFFQMVEKDLERYARELKVFKDSQKEFDRRNGLLPSQSA